MSYFRDQIFNSDWDKSKCSILKYGQVFYGEKLNLNIADT